jgi:nucleoside-diphosphate-sugar epimerase
MRVLVTGATGFVGSHLVPALLARGWSVCCLARTTSRKPTEFEQHVQWIIGDLLDPESLIEATKEVDAVIHLAGVIKARKPETFVEVNVTGTRNLLEALISSESSCPTFVFISSQAAQGPSPSRLPLPESAPARPVSRYGWSKLQAEEVILKHENRPPCIILRPCTVYGPGDRESLAFFKMAKYHVNPVIGWRSVYLNLVYVTDLVNVIIRVLEKGISQGEIFNVTDGRDTYPLREIIATAAQSLGTWTIPIFLPKWLLRTAAVVNDLVGMITKCPSMLNGDKYHEMTAQYWSSSAEKLQLNLSYEPEFDIYRGFQITADWYREQGWL